MALVNPVASFVVALDSQGRIASQGSISEALKTDERLQADFEEEQKAIDAAFGDEAEEGKEGSITKESTAPTQSDKKSLGKLTVAEDVAVGHVTWASGAGIYLARGCVSNNRGSQAIPWQRRWFISNSVLDPRDLWTGGLQPYCCLSNMVPRVLGGAV